MRPSCFLSEILSTPSFSSEDKELINAFHTKAQHRITEMFSNQISRKAIKALLHNKQCEEICLIPANISTLPSIFQDILDDLRVDRKSLKKGEASVMNAFYVCILQILTTYLDQDDLQYSRFEDFLLAYGDKFESETENEKTLLWQTANWMNILFKLTTARKNTGLTMQVIPKLVEGWNTKYITGSGMKKATANRVFLFHAEGNAPIHRRGKLKRQGCEDMDSSVDDGDDEREHSMTRKRRSIADEKWPLGEATSKEPRERNRLDRSEEASSIEAAMSFQSDAQEEREYSHCCTDHEHEDGDQSSFISPEKEIDHVIHRLSATDIDEDDSDRVETAIPQKPRITSLGLGFNFSQLARAVLTNPQEVFLGDIVENE